MNANVLRSKWQVMDISRKGVSASVVLMPQNDLSIPLDQRLVRHTENITLTIDDPKILAHFEIGKSFYLELTEASSAAASAA